MEAFAVLVQIAEDENNLLQAARVQLSFKIKAPDSKFQFIYFYFLLYFSCDAQLEYLSMCVCRRTERSAEDFARLVSRLLLAESQLAELGADTASASADEVGGERTIEGAAGGAAGEEGDAESANSRERLRHDLQTALALSGSAMRRFPGDAQLTRLRAHAFRAVGTSI